MTAPFAPPVGFELRLGFADPRDPALAAAFYPEGMPEDWQANYLCLMTEAVVLDPAAVDFAALSAACREAPRPVLGVWLGEALPADSTRLPEPLLPWAVGGAWQPDASTQGARVGLLAPGLSPRALRQALEDFARQAPAQPCALLLTGGAAAVPLLEQVRSMRDLLGW
ncbi:hypothetical protein [Halothiobacillus sp. DCM-1]|uniref:hypothetical protein n=1 Tax=Halothiobacillus sp. DCM-1 TaxID=3112558 RepID=UPI00324D4666